MALSVSNPVANPGAVGMYNQLLGMNSQNYQNILSGYGSAQSNLASELGGIYKGYGNLQQNVLGALGVTGGGWGVAAPAAKQIQQSSVQAQGNTEQQLINAGLGNSTVLGGAQNQNVLMANQAYGSLGAQLAQTAAGYESQIGLAGLGAQEQGAGMQTGLATSYLGDLAGFKFANTFGNLYGQSSYSTSPNYGYGGGGSTLGSSGGASSAIGATGAYGFGATGLGNALGGTGAYVQPGYSAYNPNNPGLGAGGMASTINSGDTGTNPSSAYYGE